MDYNLPAILAAMEQQAKIQKEHTRFGLHGGEILCIPRQDMEALLAKSHELTGCSSIQTNATLIDDDYIGLFKKYQTHVGISLDGPGELSSYRMSTQEADRINALFPRLHNEGIGTSIICVISKSNAGTPQKRRRLKDWLLWLSEMGISGRINPCGGPGTAGCVLSMGDLIACYLDLAELTIKKGLSWSPFVDMAKRARGESAVCTFMDCDPYHTDSAIVILNNGSLSNCMRTNQKDIILRHPSKHNTRDELLQEIPQEYKGCKGCEYWYACHGGCPSAAIDGDWRNRAELCPLHKAMFRFYANLMKAIQLNKRSCDQQTGHRDSHKDTPHIDSRKHTDTGGKH